jgi:transcriptional regulator with XRE-family HTH domain
MSSSGLIKTARSTRGLSQVELAQRTGFDQAVISRYEGGSGVRFSTLDKILGSTGHSLYLAPTNGLSADQAAILIGEHLKASNVQSALRVLIQLNDDLLREHGITRGVLGLSEPSATGNKAWDAAIAALVAWRLNQEALPLPGWVDNPQRFLAKNQVLTFDPADPLPTESETPDEFRKRGVLVFEDTFRSV